MKTRLDEMRQQVQNYHEKHPEVWDLFVRFSFEMINRGYKNYSAKAIFERIRWEKDAGGDGVSYFKLGNNYPSFYARRFMAMYPEHEGFFRTREQTSAKRNATGLPEMVPNDYREVSLL